VDSSNKGFSCGINVASLLQAEHERRAFFSMRHQLKAAKFPMRGDLAGIDFDASMVDKKLVSQFTTTDFTDTAQCAVLIGGPGTGKTHLATAIGMAGITAKGKRYAAMPRYQLSIQE
jgi:DNA replication protein DnaC